MAPVINMVMMPVLLLSGILLPMTLGPEWLQRVSDFMPFRGSSTRSATPSPATSPPATCSGAPPGRSSCSRSPCGGAPRSSARRTPEASRPGTVRDSCSPQPAAGYPRSGTAGTGDREQGNVDEAGVASRRSRRSCGVVLLAAACGSRSSPTLRRPAGPPRASAPAAPQGRAGQAGRRQDVAVDPPGQADRRRCSPPTCWSTARTPCDEDTIEKIKAIKGVDAGRADLDGAVLRRRAGGHLRGGRPRPRSGGSPRRAPPRPQAVWDRVADGEIAVEPAIGRKLQRRTAIMKLGNESDARAIHIGAYAELLDPTKAKRIDAVVNYKWAEQAGHAQGQRAAVAMGSTVAAEHPQAAAEVRRRPGQRADPRARPRHQRHPDRLPHRWQRGHGRRRRSATRPTRTAPSTPTRPGSSAKIRTEEMPIIGRVTGNVVMLPQLRGALNEVVSPGSAQVDLHLRRLLRPALHRPRPVQGPELPHLRHRHRPQRRRQLPRHRRQDGPHRGRHLQEAGASPGAATGTTPTRCTSSWPAGQGPLTCRSDPSTR